MFYEIFRFEMKRAFKSPSIYIYWGILFSLAFIVMNAAGGAVDGVDIRLAGDNIFINSPGVIDAIQGTFSYIGIFVVAAICTNIVLKDFRYNTLELTFSTPVDKFSYIYGRLLAAIVVSIFAFTGSGVGFYVGTLMPYLQQSCITSNEWMTYIYPYFTRVIPNIFLVASIFFTLSLLFRNLIVNWLSILGLYILYGIALTLFNDIDNQTLAALIDPFGMAASMKVSIGNSANAMNKSGVTFKDVFLYNRIVWFAISIALLTLTYFKFKFKYNLKEVSFFVKKKKESITEIAKKVIKKPKIKIEQNYFQQFRTLLRFETRNIIKNPYFLILSIITVVFLLVVSQSIGKIYDTNTYPLTYLILDILGNNVQFFIFIIILIFSGEMIWRDRDVKINEIALSYPTPQWIKYFSKLGALNICVIFIYLLLIVCGIGVQTSLGYYNYELTLYLKSVFGILYITSFLTSVIALFIHIITNNKYIGYVIVILYWVIDKYFAPSIFKHPLLIYGHGPTLSYSDMNGFGYNVFPYSIFKIYWLLIAGIIMVISILFILRQTENNWKARLKDFALCFTKKIITVIVILVFLTTAIGGYIYYNTNILNKYRSSGNQTGLVAKFEKKYKKVENTPQPKITDVKLKANVFPKSGNFTANGTYILENKESRDIDSLIINSNRYIKELSFDREVNKLVDNKKLYFRIYKLEKPLKPGEKMFLKFKFDGRKRGFTKHGYDRIVRKNGTIIYNSLFPSLGYNRSSEIQGKRSREKYKLPKREIENKIDDANGIKRNFISNDADFINFDAVISTSKNQTALTVGKLVGEWEKDGRKFFHYTSEKEVINYYPIISGRYECKKDAWTSPKGQKVDLSILYHKGHEYNLNEMMRGIKTSLDTYTKMYSDYQFHQLRIVEFPRYSTYAQSFPNLIPFSEGIGFVADLRNLNKDKEVINYPFQVTSHEMAHQWWAHQVIAADVEGSQMLMESITQYSSLQNIKKEFTEGQVHRFLRNEMFKYLYSRKTENRKERPLSRVAKYQQSIFYRKGILSLNAISNYIGVDKFNHVLQNFIKKNAFQGAPYPTTQKLVKDIMDVTPDSLKYFIDDQLNKVTFYKLSADSMTYKRNKDFTYTVKGNVKIKKFYIDDKGNKHEVPCNDYIDVGFFNSKKEQISSERLKLKSGSNKIEVTLKRKPKYSIVDPNLYLMTFTIDRDKSTIEKN